MYIQKDYCIRLTAYTMVRFCTSHTDALLAFIYKNISEHACSICNLISQQPDTLFLAFDQEAASVMIANNLAVQNFISPLWLSTKQISRLFIMTLNGC